MKRIIGPYLLIITCILFITACGKHDDYPIYKGSYLGQNPPGMTPEIFAPGIVSQAYDERMAFFTPDGKALYYQLRGAPHTVIVYMREEKGRWTKPRVAPFSGKYFAEFSLSPDGQAVILTSNSPLSGAGEPSEKFHTWIVTREKDGWSQPRFLGPVLDDIGYPTLTDSGNLYFFCYHREGGFGKGDIWMSEFMGGEYMDPVNLGPVINTEEYDVDPFISPDESYLIYTSQGPDQLGEGDLYISFKNKEGVWMKPINMGSPINSEATDFCPSVTPDGHYFFFASNRNSHAPYSSTPITYEEKIQILKNPGNGNYDIYWVDAKIIDALR